MPGRYSLFWKLAVLLVGFCLLMIALSWTWGRQMETRTAFLSSTARATLEAYAADAEQAWRRGSEAAVDAWLEGVRRREGVWVGVIGRDLQSLGSLRLSDAESQRLIALRGVDWPISRRATQPPWI